MNQKEMNEFFRANQGLIHSAVQSYRGSGEYEDLFQEASIGFFRGMSTFKEDRKTLLSTYCYRCMQNRLNEVVRKAKSKGRSAIVISYEAESQGKNGKAISGANNLDLEDCDSLHRRVFSVEEQVERHDLAIAVMRIMDTVLTEAEKQSILMSSEGQTQNYIAEKLNVSQANVSKMLKLAKGKVRYELERNGYTADNDI